MEDIFKDFESVWQRVTEHSEASLQDTAPQDREIGSFSQTPSEKPTLAVRFLPKF